VEAERIPPENLFTATGKIYTYGPADLSIREAAQGRKSLYLMI